MMTHSVPLWGLVVAVLGCIVLGGASGVLALLCLQRWQRRRQRWAPPPASMPWTRPEERERPPLPSADELDKLILDELDRHSPLCDVDLSDAICGRLGKPLPFRGFLAQCVGPRLDALEASGALFVVGFPGRLYFGPGHKVQALAAGWEPVQELDAQELDAQGLDVGRVQG